MKNKNQEELKKEIELWKKKYYTAQKVFCEHNDKVKEDNERNLRVGKNWRKAYFQLQSDFQKKINELENSGIWEMIGFCFCARSENARKWSSETTKVLKEIREIISKDNHSNSPAGGRDILKEPHSTGNKKEFPSNHTHPTGQIQTPKPAKTFSVLNAGKGNIGIKHKTAPEDVCAKQKGDFQEIKLRDVNFDDIVLCKKFKPKKETGEKK